MDDLISRQAAIDIVNRYNKSHMILKEKPMLGAASIVIELEELPPAQPEPHYDEWCTSCKEYDHERHCCPRWNHVIRTTLQDAQPEPKEGHWIEGKIYRDVIECYCSECGQIMTTAATVRMNYCPNCGAKMTIPTK